jgi:hypothetical protein
MSFNWVQHEFRLGSVPRTNYGLPVASPTDLLAEAKGIGEDTAGKWAEDRPLQGNAQSALVRQEL